MDIHGYRHGYGSIMLYHYYEIIAFDYLFFRRLPYTLQYTSQLSNIYYLDIYPLLFSNFLPEKYTLIRLTKPLGILFMQDVQ